MKTRTLMDDRILTITNRIKKAYFVFICIGSLDIIYYLSGISENPPRGEYLQGIITLVLYLLIYSGLTFKKTWLIPLVLITSAWILISTFLATLQPAVNLPDLLAKVVGIILVMFCAYQMHFFSRREVKAYFGTKETIVF